MLRNENSYLEILTFDSIWLLLVVQSAYRPTFSFGHDYDSETFGHTFY